MTPEKDPDAPPTEEEIRDSERLREALEDPSKESPDAELLRAVKNAAAPAALAPKDLDASVERGLSSSKRSGFERRGVVIRVAFSAGVLAVAAALVIFFGRTEQSSPVGALARTRSTQPLFAERFEARGGESARIDRIAMARAQDLRENHFARWGVGGNR